LHLDTLIYLLCIISVYIITFVAIALSFDCILAKSAKSVDCVGERISVVPSVFLDFSVHLLKVGGVVPQLHLSIESMSVMTMPSEAIERM